MPHSYHDAYKHLPYSTSPWSEGGPAPHTGRGWILEILPYIEQRDLYVAFEPSKQGDMFSGQGLMNCKNEMKTFLAVLRCPSDHSVLSLSTSEYQWGPEPTAVTNYKGVIGTSNMGGGWPDSPFGTTDNHNNKNCTGLFFRNSDQVKIRLNKITDGTSNTLAIGEDVHSQNHHGAAFYANGDYASSHAPLNFFPDPPDPSNWPRVMSFRSMHRGGVHFSTADGAVRFIAQDIDRLRYQQLCTRAGGEDVSIPD